ncbi:unnamed protein product [Lymnaea stagnalis]|uniref:Hexosyltransferase n=1 Tax=Lymnaea stagnalis TaxID=6523 RepID=A0AAV2I209_LYMST
MAAMKPLFKVVVVFGTVTSVLTVILTLLYNRTGIYPVHYKVSNRPFTFSEDANRPPGTSLRSDFNTLLRRYSERPGLREFQPEDAPDKYSNSLLAIEVRNNRHEKTTVDPKLNNAVEALLAQPIINDHNFEYIHNPRNACSNSPTDVLVTVPSAPGNWEKRMKVRNSSRGDYVRDQGNRARLLFFVGKGNSSEQDRIDEEVARFGDIVQETFDDVYKNIRLKAVSMLKWTSAFCQGADFVIRADDDVKINLMGLVAVLKRTALRHEHFILGRVKVEDDPARDPNSKYFLSRAEYPRRKLPRYALGGLLGYPVRTVTLLYQAALRTKPVWLDDVFITGICAPKVGVELLSDPSFDFTHKEW